ncbi:MAG: lytic transglycosylase, LysM and LysM [Holophagaceae bacterium]|nr:lytic transglycosylase, LysM and LysM [Holophagaceae bacterium]
MVLKSRFLTRVLLLLVASQLGRAETTLPAAPRTSAYVSPLGRLEFLVKAAEKALEAEDEDKAASICDEAEALVADWSEEARTKVDVAPLLERLQAVEDDLEGEEEVTDPNELSPTEEVVVLKGQDLKTEMELVKTAEAGVEYDLAIDLNDKVLSWVHSFTHDKRGFMERSLARASRYLPMVRQVFAEEGIPQDLAYLALIESGYTNKARSTASAVGMWQFIRSTGRMFGLYGNAWVEERQDPVKATRAAARYLKSLYLRDKDWYLALASYNAGPGTTDKASNGTGSRNYWDMQRSRYLRTETKHYVPKFCAAVLVGRNPERYGLKFQPEAPYTYETVQVDRMTSLAVLSRLSETPLEQLRELNPELLRGSTPPGAYQLRVPPGTSMATARVLANLPASQRLDFTSYKIRRKDTLARVASRFKLSPDDLLTANNMTLAQFKVGRTIQVPPPPLTPIDDQDLVSSGRQKAIPLERTPAIPATVADATSLPREKVEAPVELAARPSREASVKAAARKVEAPKAKFHTVKRGETLFSISERYGLEISDLRKWNKLKKGKIQAGQKLRLSRS